MTNQTTVLIINHSQIQLVGLKYMLLNTFTTHTLSLFEALTIKDAFLSYTHIQPDLLIVDLEALLVEDKTLPPDQKKILSNQPIIALSDSIRNPNLLNSFGYVFQSILSKTVQSDEFGYAIRKVLSGEQYFTDPVPLASKNGILSTIEEEIKITKREREILDLVIDNYSSKEISKKLFLSERTVETHRYNLQKKLKTANLSISIKETYTVVAKT